MYFTLGLQINIKFLIMLLLSDYPLNVTIKFVKWE